MPHPVVAQVKKIVLLVVAAGGVVTVARRLLSGSAPAPAPAPATDLARDAPVAAEVDDHAGKPSPASIAKNVPHQRPVATPAAKPADVAPSAPDDSPGGMLPPRR